MIIDIDEKLFYKVKKIVKSRNTTIYEQLKEVKTLNNINTTLQQAREIKTQRVKLSIKKTIKSLISKDINPTKYQINKRTGIAFITMNKYYDEIIDEVLNENEH